MTSRPPPSSSPGRAVVRGLLGNALCAALLWLAAGCATWQAPTDVSDAGLRARAVTASRQQVRVTAAVLSAEDSRRWFGADVNQTGVQTVWIEVHNQTAEPLWLLTPGTDPDYFSPLEVAWSVHTPLARATNARIDDHFDRLGFKNPVLPGAMHAGVLFTNPHRVTRLLNVDLLQSKTLIPFSMFLPVPDDAGRMDWQQSLFRYPASEITDYTDLAALRAALERLPCCATDAGGSAQGDPLNGALVGELPDIATALVRRSYRRDVRAVDTVQRAFGRAPDVVLRKQAQAGALATWIRAWLAPFRFEGRAVYVLQVGRPVGGRFLARDADRIVLHEDVDEVRNFLIQDMMYSGGLNKLGFVPGVGPIAQAQPRSTLGGTACHTDGLRAVMFFATRRLSRADVEILDWVPFLERREAVAREDTGHARP